MIQKIIDVIGKLPESIRSDIGLYVGVGIAVLVFVVALVVSLAGKGEFGKFVSLAKTAAKDGTLSGMNAVMSKMPKGVVGQYRRALNTGARPSESICVNGAVVMPFKTCAISKLALVTAIGTAVGICAGVGISAVFSDKFGASEGLIVALVALVGGILTLLSCAVASATFKGGKRAYTKLMEAQGGAARAESAPVREETPVSEPAPSSEPVYDRTETYAPYEQPSAEPEQSEAAPEYATPVYEQPEYAGEPVVEVDGPTPEEIEAERAHAREEALKAQRAEQEEAARKQEAEKAAAAQRRLEELRAQREAQLKARREAQAQQNASAKAQTEPTVGAEDVIARIDKISTEGASLPAMKEVAMLLQKERNKPENKNPEQQKRLNEALSKLLRAMSAAQKK